jgi:DNA polymerase-4
MILHVDMDAFYASVEERDRPELAGQPIVVGGTPEGRGVVAAANYVAREFGVHSAMPAATARRLCPHAVFLATRMEHYAEVSVQLREIFRRYTPLVEPLSLDEAFLDVTASQQLYGDATQIGRSIQQDIRQQLSLVASVGIAPNKFLAKIASDLEKPHGFVVVRPDQVSDFLEPLSVSRLWGVGRVASQVFQQLGVHTIGQLRRLEMDSLERRFGAQGHHLWELARGIDNRPVIPEHAAKSISHEKTFPQDLQLREEIHAWLLELSEQVACRLRRQQLKARTVNLKVRFEDFRTVTRAHTLPAATDSTQQIWEAVVAMLSQRVTAKNLRVRLLGVGTSGLVHSEVSQQLLFARSPRRGRPEESPVRGAKRRCAGGNCPDTQAEQTLGLSAARGRGRIWPPRNSLNCGLRSTWSRCHTNRSTAILQNQSTQLCVALLRNAPGTGLSWGRRVAAAAARAKGQETPTLGCLRVASVGGGWAAATGTGSARKARSASGKAKKASAWGSSPSRLCVSGRSLSHANDQESHPLPDPAAARRCGGRRPVIRC